MRCYKIWFDGYKRLADTGCNVDGRIIAFVGPNEVGKTSVLQGLEWLTEVGDRPLPLTAANRSRARGGKQTVVSATYRLDQNDQSVLNGMGLAEKPTDFYIERRADGSAATRLTPQVRRDPAPFELAAKVLAAASKKLERQLSLPAAIESEVEEIGSRAPEWVATVDDVLQRPDEHWNSDQIAHAEQFCAWLRETATTSRSGKPRDEKAAGLIEAALAIGRTAHPDAAARAAIQARVPMFIRFTDEHRELSMTHNLADDQVRASPPGALANLLKVAGINLDLLWGHVQNGADTLRETLLRQGNERLRLLFSQAWNQEDITVHLNLSGTLLQIMVDELSPDGSRTTVEERSDGLQTFIALVAFLARQDFQVPPILLVDEAETHLHLDAQADLVDVLLQNIDATQVFYTTHSPGCLPRDLGTGVRLVKKDPTTADASLLRADFWTNAEPGFSPLLFAMGASAAAFSVCRRAVLAEGAADMILLPSMLQKVTGLEDVGYQIAPGLSNAHAYGMNVEEIAARVAYLTDGDKGGKTLKEQLRASGVADDRIFSLPDDVATEDLLETSYYLSIVNSLIPKTPGSLTFTRSNIKPKKPVGKSLEDWGKKTGVQVPGKVAVASAIAGDRANIVLASGADATLLALHERFLAALGIPLPATK